MHLISAFVKNDLWCSDLDGKAACVLSHFHHVRLCDPIDRSQPGSSVHRVFPGKNTGVSCHALLQGISWSCSDLDGKPRLQQKSKRILCCKQEFWKKPRRGQFLWERQATIVPGPFMFPVQVPRPHRSRCATELGCASSCWREHKSIWWYPQVHQLLAI